MKIKKAHMVQIKNILLLLAVAILFACNKHGPTCPDNLPPGSRDYVWTCDTLYSEDNPFVYIARLWGCDSANVWAVGLGGQDGVWRFDGKKWTINRSENMITVFALYGFGPNNIWAGNTFGSIYRCTDSKNWQEVKYYVPNGYLNISYNEMWGTSPTEIYAAGSAKDPEKKTFKIFAIKYSGSSWSVMNLPDLAGQIGYIRKQKSSGIILIVILENEYNNPNMRKIYAIDGKNLMCIFPGARMVALNDMEGEVYITIDQRIYKYWKGGLILWKDFRNTIFCDRIWGRNEKDFFFATLINGKYGIGHYNGENMVELFRPEPNYGVFEGIVLEKDVFFLGRDDFTNKSIIIHGRRRGSE